MFCNAIKNISSQGEEVQNCVLLQKLQSNSSRHLCLGGNTPVRDRAVSKFFKPVQSIFILFYILVPSPPGFLRAEVVIPVWENDASFFIVYRWLEGFKDSVQLIIMWNSAGTVTWALTWAAGWSLSSPHQQPLWECHCALCPVPLTVWGIPRAASASRGHFNAFIFFPDKPVSVSQWQWICDLCSMVNRRAGGGCPAPVPLTPTLLLFIVPPYTKHKQHQWLQLWRSQCSVC